MTDLRVDYADCVWGIEADHGDSLTLVGSNGRRVIPRDRWDRMPHHDGPDDVFPVAAGLLTLEQHRQDIALSRSGRPPGESRA